MEILQLKYFQAVARHEHMTHAAEELHVSQPSLSKVISRLEEELGVMLFDRQGRNIRINSFGRAFLKRVDKVFNELEDGKKELADMSGLEQGRILLAWTSIALLPRILEGFLKEYPNVSFKQTMPSTLDMKHQLENHMIDFCISSPPVEGQGIVCQPLYSDEIFLAVPQKHRFADRESIDLIEAVNEPFISTKQGYGFRDITDELCSQAGFTPNIVFEGDVAISSINLVKAGLGVTFVSSTVEKNYQGVLPKLLRINKPVCERTISLSYLEGHYLSKAAQQFRQYLIDFFQEDNSSK
ncbi:MAG: LysR family transcriptional regulator [Clostridia bacterium]|jgi:DNA-binding transcriptional LysR family regulator|nr:LysR family transcriptional regulator [Clostridia bacterium]